MRVVFDFFVFLLCDSGFTYILKSIPRKVAFRGTVDVQGGWVGFNDLADGFSIPSRPGC